MNPNGEGQHCGCWFSEFDSHHTYLNKDYSNSFNFFLISLGFKPNPNNFLM
jgi:hypothetical protein